MTTLKLPLQSVGTSSAIMSPHGKPPWLEDEPPWLQNEPPWLQDEPLWLQNENSCQKSDTFFLTLTPPL
jgi:hypothetical protein